MKKITITKKLIVLALAVMLVFALVSCVEPEIETERGNLMKAECKAMVEALIANDVEAAYKLFIKEMNKQAFEASFPGLVEYVEGVETFELTQIGWYTGTDNGLNYYEAIFRMESNAGSFKISAVEVEGYEGLYNFHIVNENEYENYTGTITKMKGASPFQWGMIIFSALCLGFVIWMLVDCIKRRIKYKPLWIVLILLGALVFTVTADSTGADFNVGAMLMLFSYSYLQVYAAGMVIFKLTLPVGAIIYLIFRKKFVAMAKAEDDYKKNIYSQTEEGVGAERENADGSGENN
jgi:hypothetical protein